MLDDNRLTPESADEVDRDLDADSALLCAACRSRITWADARIEVAGQHHHEFANPHGIIYQLGCYRAAPGCREASPPTLEWTWFAGYRWSIALCAACEIHLGWRFSADTDHFFGLLSQRLVPAAG